jgi:spore coat protein U-like protein
MSLWKITRLTAAAACTAFLSVNTWAVLSCTISASPPTLTGNYDPASNLDVQGSFTVNCTRAKNDSKSQTLWIGLNQTSAQTMAKAAPYADTLTYGIYSDVNRTALWTGGATGGVSVPLSFGTATSASAAPAFYMRANAGQTDKAAGTYSDTLNVTLNVTNSTGQNLGNTTLTTQATVPKTCSVSAAAVSYAVSYQAFRSSALVDSSQSVSVSCSKGTQANLSLDKTTGVLLPIGLAYQLGFSPSSSATTAATSTSNAVPLSLGLILTLPARQAGACGAGTCSGSDTRQIMITY